MTKHDPADRDEHGRSRGPGDAVGDRGPVEAAYLDALAAFARESGVEELTVRDAEVHGLVPSDAEPAEEPHGLPGLFPPDLTGYHDGARVPVAVGLELVRVMLRGGRRRRRAGRVRPGGRGSLAADRRPARSGRRAAGPLGALTRLGARLGVPRSGLTRLRRRPTRSSSPAA
ncbi:hypothetical protein [Saccharothrix xinjiangensis]|uniref:Uncharacterized protein n=1 Tax=Saccharothrix xinjiangensis TaxID=204798 RepID=A0ABV9Y0L7_9PSEU